MLHPARTTANIGAALVRGRPRGLAGFAEPVFAHLSMNAKSYTTASAGENSDAGPRALVPRFPDAKELTVDDIMASGLHVGHSFTQPKSGNLGYVLGRRNGLYIIDPVQTLAHLRRAATFLRLLAHVNGIVCFVANHERVETLAYDAAIHARGTAYYVPEWRRGTLCNPIRRLQYSVANGEDPRIYRRPDVLVLLDIKSPLGAATAVEARVAGVPTIAVVDTDIDPTWITYPIPGNDDGITGLRLVTEALAEAARRGMECKPKITEPGARLDESLESRLIT